MRAIGITSKAELERVATAVGRDVSDKANLPTIAELKRYMTDNK